MAVKSTLMKYFERDDREMLDDAVYFELLAELKSLNPCTLTAPADLGLVEYCAYISHAAVIKAAVVEKSVIEVEATIALAAEWAVAHYAVDTDWLNTTEYHALNANAVDMGLCADLAKAFENGTAVEIFKSLYFGEYTAIR
jgi:hypothetical protein